MLELLFFLNLLCAPTLVARLVVAWLIHGARRHSYEPGY